MNGDDMKAILNLTAKLSELAGCMKGHMDETENRQKVLYDLKADNAKQHEDILSAVSINTNRISTISERCSENLPLIKKHMANGENKKIRSEQNRLTIILAMGGWGISIFLLFLKLFANGH